MSGNHNSMFKNTYVIGKLILGLEWIWIGIMIFAFWHISPPIRDRYVFLLLFTLPIYATRYVVHGRLFTRTPLDILLVIFVIATAYNFHNSPLSRADYWALVCRPFLGILMIYYFVENVRNNGHPRYLIAVTVCLATLIGLVALLASQWTISDKSQDFAFIINLLPKLDSSQVFPDMQLSFNPNEIAGALAYCCPFLLGIGLGSFRETEAPQFRFAGMVKWIEKWGALIGFSIAFLALFLGQSRFALAGTLVAMLLVILFILPTWRLRAVGVGLWGCVVLLEVLLVLNILPLDFSQPSDVNTTAEQTETTGLNQRDERTFLARFDLWHRAIQMTLDYPTTGAGMSVYRAMVTREAYEIPLYVERGTRPPHAHNALFQMGADLGVIGWILFIGWYSVDGWMALYAFRNGNLNFKIMTIAVAGSILGYMGYGVGDTITLWDRFAFIHWWYIGLMTAIFIGVKFNVHIKNL